ncbi:MAG: hypothetical protein ACFHHU_18755 [Porticoccaceae bacterium]
MDRTNRNTANHDGFASRNRTITTRSRIRAIKGEIATCTVTAIRRDYK